MDIEKLQDDFGKMLVETLNNIAQQQPSAIKTDR